MLWYLPSGLYLVMWSALLVHCLLRRQFYPVFGTGRGTKVFWLLTFVFFNPLLTFLYFVFGFLLRPVKAGESGKPVRFGSIGAIVFVGFVLVFYEWPFSGYDAEPVVVHDESQEPVEPALSAVRRPSRESPEDSESSRGLEGDTKREMWRLGTEAHLAMVKAKNGVQTFGSTSAQSETSASVRSVMLICRNPHYLLDRVTRQLQQSLLRLPDVDKVEYYPYGTWPEPGGILPDVFITVDTLEFHETAFLLSRRLKTLVQWKVGNILLQDSKIPALGGALVAFNAESRLDHESAMMGIESPRAKYKLEADGISAEMTKSISKQFASLLDKHGGLPKVPAVLYGTYCEPPTFSFLTDHAAERVISGSGLLKNNCTVWRFAERRGADEALRAYRDELNAAGWGSEELGKDYLWMRRQNEHIYILHGRRYDLAGGALGGGQPDLSPAGSSGVSMIAQYASDFTDDQIRKAVDALLASETQIETLLAFERYFTPEQSERLRAVIETAPGYSLDGSLMLGRYWAGRGQMDKGRQWLMRARAMLCAEKEPGTKTQEIRSLAKKLADESLADVPISGEVLREVGFVNAGQLTEPLKTERNSDEPVLLYRRLDNGQFHTLALRVIRSRDASPSAPYILLVVERREGRSGSSETAGASRPDGVWAAESVLQNLAGEGKSVQLTVESMGNKRFLFVIRP